MKRLFFLLLLFFNTISIGFGELSIQEKIEGRSRPSIFSPWSDWFVNKPDMPYAEMTAAHDLLFAQEFGLRFQRTGTDVQLAGDFIEARRQRGELLELNPNMILLLDINLRRGYPDVQKDFYGGDFPWVRDENENMIEENREESSDAHRDFLIDFVDPIAQEIIINQVVAVANSGLWNGVFFDYWNEKGVILGGFRTYEEEQAARTAILKGIRTVVGDDFLIIVNNPGTLTRAIPYINGIFIESFREELDDYQHAGLIEIENSLLWAEKNLQEPQINALEAEGIGSQLPSSPENLKAMRCLTTLSLTHSDGYFLYTMGVQWDEPHPHDSAYLDYQGAAFRRNPRYWTKHRENHNTFSHSHHHEHYYYDFWDAELSQPIGERGQTYNSIEGLFIREFTNGWAVYNRSGESQEISLPIQTTGVESGITSFKHTVPDLDGEMFLKTGVTADVNGDGVVNIQDLVIVANALGKAEPDVNGDGVVNIQDLVIVANAFE
ncbi:MAG: dockerin type I domain-containing protein [Candidatus Poribacteria bacterium]|nr:dockerin type I domain-containing protein [Candidatus Poribacteria bacterium]